MRKPPIFSVFPPSNAGHEPSAEVRSAVLSIGGFPLVHAIKLFLNVPDSLHSTPESFRRWCGRFLAIRAWVLEWQLTTTPGAFRLVFQFRIFLSELQNRVVALIDVQ